MAGFHTKTFMKHDNYMTPKSAWENIKDYIPKNKVIWEPFYGDGASGKHLTELGFNVIHEPIDFFTNDKGQVIVSNPPFSMKKEVLIQLKKNNKPFIMIMPSSAINTLYVRQLFADCDDKLQIIIPRRRIQFEKIVNGAKVESNRCNFDCFYYCWKINLARDIIWLK